MGVVVETTPNPRAMKFNVGSPVGETASATSAEGADERIGPLFEIDGVMSVFMTADFVTISASEGSSWDAIVPEAKAILERSFG
jgi:hypothetical protein